MSPSKCCLCCEPSNEFPGYFKTVLTDFRQHFKTFQSSGFDSMKVDKLTLCNSCWIYFMRAHHLNHELYLKKETCDAKKAFLASKIQRVQRLLDESENNGASCEDFEMQFSGSESNEDNEDDCQVSVQNKHDGNQPLAANEARNRSLRSPPLPVPCSTSLKTTADSDAESIEFYEITYVISTATDTLSPAAISAEKAPVEVTADDTMSEVSDSESEPVEPLREPVEATSDDTTSESENRRRVSSRSKRLPKSTKKTSGGQFPSSNVNRLSETEFTYLNKYPFQRTDVGFKCGLCSAISYVNKGPSRIYYNILKHIDTWHIRSDKVRSNKTLQRFIEIAPNRFQYGKYKVELIDGNYRCEECGELRAVRTSGFKPANIVDHIKRHHENPSKSYVCDQCGKVYSKPFGLSEHKKSKHQNSDNLVPCSECGKTFATRWRASLHEKVVHGIKKKFICEICGKECIRKLQLKIHIAFVHNGEKMKCNDCDKMFGSQLALNIHRYSHLGKKFTCDICGMDLTQQGSGKRHKRTAHSQ